MLFGDAEQTAMVRDKPPQPPRPPAIKTDLAHPSASGPVQRATRVVDGNLRFLTSDPTYAAPGSAKLDWC